LQFNKRRYFSLIRIGIVSTAPTPQIEHNGFAAQVGKLELAATEQWQFEVSQQLACKILNQTVRAAVFLGSTLRLCVILRAAEPGDQEKRTREKAFDKIDHLAMFNDAAYWAADILVNYSRFPPLLRYPATPPLHTSPFPAKSLGNISLIFMLAYVLMRV
jgi:hypothetical protein